MYKIHALTPLNSDYPASNRFDGINITEVNDLSLVILMKRLESQKDFYKLAKNILKVDLPEISKSSAHGKRTIRWIRPDTWIIESPYTREGRLETEMKDLFGHTATVIGQSDAFCLFDLEGSHCTEVLTRLCNVDSSKMKKGDISATRMEHLSCFLVCKKEEQQYRIMGPRSAAASIQSAIISAINSVA